MKTKLMLKIVSLLTAVSFLYTNVVWAAPQRLLAAEEKEAAGSTLAAKSQLMTEEDRKEFSESQQLVSQLFSVAANILPVYENEAENLPEKSEGGAVDLAPETKAKIVGALAADVFKPEILWGEIRGLDVPETKGLDILAVPVLVKGKRGMLIVRKRGNAEQEKIWDRANERTKIVLPQVIKMTLVDKEYVGEFHNIASPKELNAYMSTLEKESKTSAETKEIVKQVRDTERAVTQAKEKKAGKDGYITRGKSWLLNLLVAFLIVLAGCGGGGGGSGPLAVDTTYTIVTVTDATGNEAVSPIRVLTKFPWQTLEKDANPVKIELTDAVKMKDYPALKVDFKMTKTDNKDYVDAKGFGILFEKGASQFIRFYIKGTPGTPSAFIVEQKRAIGKNEAGETIYETFRESSVTGIGEQWKWVEIGLEPDATQVVFVFKYTDPNAQGTFYIAGLMADDREYKPESLVDGFAATYTDNTGALVSDFVNGGTMVPKAGDAINGVQAILIEPNLTNEYSSAGIIYSRNLGAEGGNEVKLTFKGYKDERQKLQVEVVYLDASGEKKTAKYLLSNLDSNVLRTHTFTLPAGSKISQVKTLITGPGRAQVNVWGAGVYRPEIAAETVTVRPATSMDQATYLTNPTGMQTWKVGTPTPALTQSGNGILLSDAIVDGGFAGMAFPAGTTIAPNAKIKFITSGTVAEKEGVKQNIKIEVFGIDEKTLKTVPVDMRNFVNGQRNFIELDLAKHVLSGEVKGFRFIVDAGNHVDGQVNLTVEGCGNRVTAEVTPVIEEAKLPVVPAGAAQATYLTNPAGMQTWKAGNLEPALQVSGNGILLSEMLADGGFAGMTYPAGGTIAPNATIKFITNGTVAEKEGVKQNIKIEVFGIGEKTLKTVPVDMKNFINGQRNLIELDLSKYVLNGEVKGFRFIVDAGNHVDGQVNLTVEGCGNQLKPAVAPVVEEAKLPVVPAGAAQATYLTNPAGMQTWKAGNLEPALQVSGNGILLSDTLADGGFAGMTYPAGVTIAPNAKITFITNGTVTEKEGVKQNIKIEIFGVGEKTLKTVPVDMTSFMNGGRNLIELDLSKYTLSGEVKGFRFIVDAGNFVNGPVNLTVEGCGNRVTAEVTPVTEEGKLPVVPAGADQATYLTNPAGMQTWKVGNTTPALSVSGNGILLSEMLADGGYAGMTYPAGATIPSNAKIKFITNGSVAEKEGLKQNIKIEVFGVGEKTLKTVPVDMNNFINGQRNLIELDLSKYTLGGEVKGFRFIVDAGNHVDGQVNLTVEGCGNQLKPVVAPVVEEAKLPVVPAGAAQATYLANPSGMQTWKVGNTSPALSVSGNGILLSDTLPDGGFAGMTYPAGATISPKPKITFITSGSVAEKDGFKQNIKLEIFGVGDKTLKTVPVDMTGFVNGGRNLIELDLSKYTLSGEVKGFRFIVDAGNYVNGPINLVVEGCGNQVTVAMTPVTEEGKLPVMPAGAAQATYLTNPAGLQTWKVGNTSPALSVSGNGILLSETLADGGYAGMSYPAGATISPNAKITFITNGSVAEKDGLKQNIKIEVFGVGEKTLKTVPVDMTGFVNGGRNLIELDLSKYALSGEVKGFRFIVDAGNYVNGPVNLTVEGLGNVVAPAVTPVVEEAKLLVLPAGAAQATYMTNPAGLQTWKVGDPAKALTVSGNGILLSEALSDGGFAGMTYPAGATIPADAKITFITNGTVAEKEGVKQNIKIEVFGIDEKTLQAVYVDMANFVNGDRNLIELDLSKYTLSGEVKGFRFLVDAGNYVDGLVNLTVEGCGNVVAPPLNLALREDAESKEDIQGKLEKGFLRQTWGKAVTGALLKGGEIAVDTTVKADTDLDKSIADVDKKIEALLTEAGIKQLINIDKLPAGVTAADVIARIKDVLSGKTKVGAKKDKVLEFCYLDGFTINDAVLLHAGKKYGRVYMPREMVKAADGDRVALAKLHEVLHHVFPEDANHTIIKNDTVLMKGLLADMVEKSNAAVVLNKKVADETAIRNGVASVADLRGLEKPEQQEKPVALWLTDDPDVNMTILDAAKRLVEQGRNVKIFMLGKQEYNFSAKDRKALMELKGKDGKPVVAAYVLLAELLKAAGKDIDEKMAVYASDVLGQKVEITDMALINSPYEEYQAVKVTRMPNIQPPARALNQPLTDIADAGKLMDVGELAVLAHRLVGDKMYGMTFDDLAKSLPTELQAQFLATVEALGLEKTENVAEGFAKIPPTTSITGELQTSVNTMRATMIAA